jgi:hypothetical protein
LNGAKAMTEHDQVDAIGIVVNADMAACGVWVDALRMQCVDRA